MLREGYREKIKKIERELLFMGDMVIKAIKRSIEALKARDIEEAKRIIHEDRLINSKQVEIEEACINLIATQQPVAGELRELISFFNIITELERIGDYAEGIAKIVVMLGDEPPVKPLIDIPRMAEKATDMIKRSLEAFIKQDTETAKAVWREDDEVDSLYEQIFRELLSFMAEHPRIITRATYLIWTAHNLERIADRATNICERTVFLVTGSLEESDVSKY
jgi:phosphate transport system protein